jgi:hypothetical protein
VADDSATPTGNSATSQYDGACVLVSVRPSDDTVKFDEQ